MNKEDIGIFEDVGQMNSTDKQDFVTRACEEFDELFEHFTGDEYDLGCEKIYNTSPQTECNCYLKDIKQFLTKKLEEQKKSIIAECVKKIKNGKEGKDILEALDIESKEHLWFKLLMLLDKEI